MKHKANLRVGLLGFAAAMFFQQNIMAGQYIVKDGQPRAEIVLAENPASSVKLAAAELQAYIAKISGATLPVRTAEEAGAGGKEAGWVRIWLGQSPQAEQLGLAGDDFEWGAYHVQTGDGWLVLIGNDTAFKPRGIHAWTDEAKKQWDEATGAYWDNPIAGYMRKNYNREFDLWSYDEKGTLNAVYGFLRRLGVRWYMAGELGEIVPEMKTIALPEIDETVRPDYSIRMVNYALYGVGAHQHHWRDTLIWSLRLGVNNPFGWHTHHGIGNITRRAEARQKHPEFYADYARGSDAQETKTPAACLSSESLFQENLRFARFLFDMYDVPVVDVMPDDGFSVICQCDQCRDQAAPERGRQGIFSDYVWNYINRIAIEIARSHPGRYIKCGAYSTYWLPPVKIEKLSDNIIVYLVNARRRYHIAEWQKDLRRRVAREWQAKTGNPILTFQNPAGGANTPRIFADDIKDLKGVAMGEDLWAPWGSGSLAFLPGFHHLNYFISAQFEWDADQDVDAVLDEYYRLFYGPASDEMSAFIDFYEMHVHDIWKIHAAPIIRQALDFFEAAKDKVEPDSVYGQRLALFEEGLAGIKQHYEKIKDGRVDVPVYPLARETAEMAEIKIDGRLDETFWSDLPGTLKHLETGDAVTYPTQFKIGLSGHDLYVGIICRDEPGRALNAAEVPRNDFALWLGDVVELLLETPEHSYYQIAINPRGSVADIDRGSGLAHGVGWDAQAEIAVHVDEGAGYWSVEVKIPFTPSSQDPLHEVVGPPPSAEQPWYFNVCRQRTSAQSPEIEFSAFSPTGQASFHNVLKFGEMK